MRLPSPRTIKMNCHAIYVRGCRTRMDSILELREEWRQMYTEFRSGLSGEGLWLPHMAHGFWYNMRHGQVLQYRGTV